MDGIDELRWQQRLRSFGKALRQLEGACRQDQYSDLERAGLVQLFEFTFELAWKTLKDLLTHEGIDVSSPREAVRRAFEAAYVLEEDAESLLDALGKRNLLAHTYDESAAREAQRLITGCYAPVLRRLFDRLEERRSPL